MERWLQHSGGGGLKDGERGGEGQPDEWGWGRGRRGGAVIKVGGSRDEGGLQVARQGGLVLAVGGGGGGGGRGRARTQQEKVAAEVREGGGRLRSARQPWLGAVGEEAGRAGWRKRCVARKKARRAGSCASRARDQSCNNFVHLRPFEQPHLCLCAWLVQYLLKFLYDM